jgi:hypothetical protein
MPVKLGKKSYKNFAGAKKAVKESKGLSDKRASAYVASIERAQGKDRGQERELKKEKLAPSGK